MGYKPRQKAGVMVKALILVALVADIIYIASSTDQTGSSATSYAAASAVSESLGDTAGKHCRGPNEVYACGGACDNVCKTLHTQNQTNCPIVNIRCNDNCYCKKGYARDINQICIPIEKCPKPICGKHEVFSHCVQRQCTPRRCSEVGFPGICPKVEDCDCQKGCICEKGYVRNAKGDCVPISHCPPKCGKHEVFSHCVQRQCTPRRCSEVGYPGICPKVEDCDCQKGCICEKGYVRNAKGDCVPISHCPPKCGKYEVFSHCVQRQCTPRRCSEVGYPGICPKVEDCDCQKGCICEKGYVRNAKGVCVPISHCPPKCRKYEVFSHCVQRQCTPRRCSEVGFPGICPKVEDCDCQKGCICEKGYVRNAKGDCVPISHCPPKCGKYEVFSHCVQRQCTPRRCSEVGFPGICPKVEDCDCQKGCICEKGYVRIEKGDCVPINHCPPRCRKHEVFTDCIQRQCGPRTCSEVGFPFICHKINPAYCKTGCICEKGYVRNAQGYCIPVNQCTSCGGDDKAKPGCGVYCNQRCSDIGKEPKSCIAVCYKNACDCKKGFFYDSNQKKCVSPKDCTRPCGINEVFSNCVEGTCNPQYCTQLGIHIPCRKINPKYCTKGCLCKQGYVRNKKGICIPTKECQKCKGPNEHFFCGPPCDNVCSDLHKQSKDKCLIKSNKCVPRCYCKDGYARNSKGICVEICDCPSG